jgi:hypothetical protein
MQTTFASDIENNTDLQTGLIAMQNDLFRRALDNSGVARDCYEKGITGNVVFSHSVAARSGDFQIAALRDVAAFNEFDKESDPHGDHSFGVVTVGKRRLFWKIDLYDLELEKGSERPFDPACTERVLTIMEPQDY